MLAQVWDAMMQPQPFQPFNCCIPTAQSLLRIPTYESEMSQIMMLGINKLE